MSLLEMINYHVFTTAAPPPIDVDGSSGFFFLFLQLLEHDNKL